MAESSWPSPSNGRVVDDIQYEKIGITTGPYYGVLGDFTSPQLIYGDSSGRQIKIAADRYALVRGHVWWSGSTIVTKAIAANSSGSTRIDLIVLRLDRTTWNVTCEIVQGTPGAGEPNPTQNQGTTGVFEMVLAVVTVANGAATITAGNVNYVGPHLDPAGGRLRIPAVTYPWAPPAAFIGSELIAADGTLIRWNGSSYEQIENWQNWTPTVFNNLSTTRTTYGGSVTINRARYMKSGKTVTAMFDITIVGATTNGLGISLPVNAATRIYAIGSAAVYNNTSPPSNQSGVASCGPVNGSSQADNAHVLTTSNGYVNTVSGTNAFRGYLCYEI